MTKQDEFEEAVLNNNFNQVELLLKNVNIDPSGNDGSSFRAAAKYGYTNIVKLLLNDSRVDPSEWNDHDYAFRSASENGHLEIIKILLEDHRINPANVQNLAILESYSNGHVNIVEILWKDKRIKNTLQNDNKDLYDKLIKQDIKSKVGKF